MIKRAEPNSFELHLHLLAFSPSHYGQVLPFRLPNTEILGSISSTYFARPDAATADERHLYPDVEIDLEDKDAAWGYIVGKYGASSHNL